MIKILYLFSLFSKDHELQTFSYSKEIFISDLAAEI